MAATKLSMEEKLAESGLNKTDAKKLGYKELSREKTNELTKKKQSSILIPYYDLDGKKNCFWRTRYLEFPTNTFKSEKKLRKNKYSQPSGATPKFYLPPILPVKWREVAEDPGANIYMTEGEFKAACATKMGFPTIGLGGVYNWKSNKALIPSIKDFDAFEWEQRNVYLVFDSDMATNDKVKIALQQLAKHLNSLGAMVYVIALPHVEGKKTGLDDYLVEHGRESFGRLIEEADPFNLTEELWKLNTEVALVEDPGVVVNLKTGQIMYGTDFKTVIYANRFYHELDKDGRLVKKSAANAWLKWEHRFTLSKFTFKPGEPRYTDDGEYNLWKGWGCEPKKGSIKPWKDLLDYVFGDDKESRTWFERWCAIQVQQPGIKLYSAVLMWGIEQGTGKSMIGYTLGKIFGKNFREIRQQQLHSPYNDWSAGVQFIMGDEITGSDKRQDADNIKGMITQLEIFVNGKYQKPYTIPDCINYYFTSNRSNAFFLDDDDRRMFVWGLNKEPLSDKFYSVYDEWLHGEGPAHLFQHLLKLDLGDFNAKKRAPMTNAKEDMIVDGKSDLASWCYELKLHPDHILKVDNYASDCDLWTNKQLLFIYDPEGKTRVTANGLGRELTAAGIKKLPPVKIDGRVTRLYAVRDQDKWLKAKPNKAADHWYEYFGDKGSKY